jgi:hypothetical protein
VTLDAVYDALRASLAGTPPNQTIELVAAARRPALVELAPLLARLRIAGAWTLTGAAVARRRDAVELTGGGHWALPGATGDPVAVAVTLTATAPGPELVAFELALAIADAGWTLERSLATPQAPLPETFVAVAGRVGLRWTRRSAIADATVDGATVTARSGAPALGLTGNLRPVGPLVDYAPWVGPWPLRLSGELTLSQDPAVPPAFALRALSSDTLTLGPLTVRDVGFGLRSLTGLDPELAQRTAYTTLELLGTVRVGDAVEARLRAPLLGAVGTFHLFAELDHPPPLSGGLAAIGALFGVDPGLLSIPPGLSGLDSFRLSEVEALLERSRTGGPPDSLEAIAVTVESPEPWRPPIPGLRLIDVGTRWLVTWDADGEALISGSVFGSIAFGEGDDPPAIDLLAALSRFVLTGGLRDEERPIPLDTVFRTFLGAGPSTGGLQLTGLTLLADPAGQTYAASAEVTTNWALPFFSGLELTSVGLWIDVTQSDVAGGVEGLLTLTRAAGGPALRLSAAYRTSDGGGWVFAGGLEPGPVPTVADLVALIAGTAPDALRAVTVERLHGEVDTGRETWELDGALAARFDLTLLDVQLRIEAGASVALAKDAAGDTSGSVSGRFTVNRVGLTFTADVGVPDPAYALTVHLGDVWLTATVAWKAAHDGIPKHRVATLQLGGITLGELLEELVRLAAPTLGFELEPPWDELLRIDLSRFTLTLDPTERLVEMRYAVNADLLLLSVETVGIRYRIGGESTVELIVEGRLMGQPFRGPDALAWDVVRDPPPQVPGKSSLLELRYLALGQRIRLSDPQPDTVSDAIERLRRSMEPREGTDVDPLAGSGMVFDAASGWLAALDLTAMGTVDVALVFSDPNVYGLAVGLHGDKAGSLAGLRFEILYKRLGDGIGMFRVELALPEAFRHIELGEVSVTLGVVVVEVYTNGNFLVDLGFPHQRDFSRAFTVQVFPFVGRGGIYLGVLNGTTSRRVPAVVNGTFAPVLELGVGLAVGVGKEVEIGPLAGGVYVQVEVVFQGVLAWFEPQGGGGSARYHWAQAVAAIHGRLYGEVDFKVVKASVSLEAYAQASVTLEAHRATVFALEVKVEAEAEVEILWVSVSFSFEVEYDASFTVGSDTQAPWTLADGGRGAGDAGALLRAPRRLLAVQRAAAVETLLGAGDALRAAAGAWRPDLPVFGGARRRAALTLLPFFTLAGAATDWRPPVEPAAPDPGAAVSAPPGAGDETPASAPPGAGDQTPAWRVAFALFAPDGSTAGARTAAAAAAPEPEPDAPAEDRLPAAVLVEALLRWALASVSGSEPGKVTAGQLALLGDQLADPDVTDAAFTLRQLRTFFETNLVLEVSGDAGGRPVGAMALPLPPFLTLSASSDPQPRDLETLNRVGPDYARGAAAYMAGWTPQPAAGAPPREDVPADYVSFAAHVFVDWCLLTTREAVRTATATLANRTVLATGGSLDALAADATLFPRDTVSHVVRAGDTVAQVAVTLGATVAELEQLNPGLAERLASAAAGDTIAVVVGVTGATLAEQNAAVALAPNAVVPVTGVRVQVRADDSLDTVSRRLYGAADPVRLVADAQLAGARVLLAGATVPLPARTDPLGAGAGAALVAGVVYMRYFADPDVPLADWYAQAVADLNPTALEPYGPGVALPAGLTLTVPAAPDGRSTTTYRTVTGDSLLQIGAALSLAQNPAGYADPRWQAFRAEVRAAGAVVTVPARDVALLSGETLDLLQARLLAPDAATLLGWIHAAPLLTPLAVLVVRQLDVRGAATLADVAAATGLTVAELAARPEVGAAAGLFAARTPLRLDRLPAQSVETLVTETCSGSRLTDVSHQVSRMLLAGTRLPAPQERDGHMEATGLLTALAELTGQQLSAPPLDGTTGLTASVTKNGGDQLDWIVLDPAGGRGSVDFAYDAAALRDRYPAATLALAPRRPGPRPIAVAGEVPRTHGLDHRVDVQAATALPIPGAAVGGAGNPTLWPLPASLLALARAGSTVPFDLLRAAHGSGDVADHDPIQDATFATHVALTLRRVPGASALYELLDADAADRDLLLALSRSARDDPRPPSDRPRMALFIAVAPVPGAADPNGLALLAADPDATFAIRTDMATDVPLSAPPAVLSAPLSSAADFLQLLWEGSGTRPGTCLSFATTQGDDLPPGAFGPDGSAVVWLLAVDRRQQVAAPAGRTLLTTDTCALVGPGLDAQRHALYAEAHAPQDHPSELVRQAVLPPGTAGVELAVPRPPAPDGAPDPAQARLAQRFSLLLTALAGTYAARRLAPPLPPLRDDGSGLPLWRARRVARAARLAGRPLRSAAPAQWWRYEQVVPVASFGPPSVAPEVVGLPAPAEDPYRGYGDASALPLATFQLGFADLLGNATAEPFGRTVDAPVGYTDPLLGLRAWPATTCGWSVARAGDHVTLTVAIASQPATFAPAPDSDPVAAAASAAQQARRLAEAYFQLAQPTVRGKLLTTLVQGRDGSPTELPLVEGTTPLWRYLAGATLFARAAAALVPAPLGSDATVAQVLADFGVTPGGVATVNGGRAASRLLRAGQPLSARASVRTGLGDSAETVVAQVPAGWPRPTPAGLLEANAGNAPLQPGVVVAVPPYTLQLGPDAPSRTVAEVAAAQATTPAQLAVDAGRAPVLAAGLSFAAHGQTVVTDATVNSFAAVRDAFAQLAVEVALGELADGIAERRGVFAANAALPLRNGVAGDGMSLAALAARAGASAVRDVAPLNVAVRDLFPAGTALDLGAWPTPTPVPPGAETLDELAGRLGTTAAALLAANGASALADQSVLTVPGAAVLPAAGVRVPYAAGGDDTLAAIPARFATDVARLAQDNRGMPGLLPAGTEVTVTVGGSRRTTTATAADSLTSIWRRLHDQDAGVDFALVVAAVAPLRLATGALLSCPAAALAPRAPLTAGSPIAASGAAMTSAEVAAAYGVDELAFAQANAALVGVLAPGVPLRAPSGEQETTTAHDTLNALLSRFAARGLAVALEELLSANPGAALYSGGARALLPPPPATVSAALGAAAGPYAEPAFPLVTTVRLQRDAAVVDPSLATPGRDGPVERADAVVPAPTSSDRGAARTLDAFVDACLAALPNLRLASAKARGEAADLWAVDFAAGGIAQVALTAPVTYPGRQTRAPRCLALRPLYTAPQSRADVPVQPLGTDGRLGEAAPASFAGADVETWARRLLADLDLVLAPASVAGIYRHVASRPDLATLLQLRWRLANALAAGLAPVLKGSDARAADGAAAAAATLARACGSSLAAAYDVTLAVQYDEQASASYPAPPAPTARLHGSARGTRQPGTATSFSGADAPLLPTPSFSTFLLSVADPAGQAVVEPGPLAFAADALELDVRTLDGTDGAQSGEWLTFVRPLTGGYATGAIAGDLGAPSLPIPLRALPMPPLLLDQGASATAPGPRPPLTEAARWTFSVTYAHEHAAQDELQLRALFNIPGPPGPQPLVAGTDLAAELWRWASVAEPLREQLGWYAAGPDRGTAPAGVLDNAAHALATLLGPIVAAWEGHWAGGAADARAAAEAARLGDGDPYDLRVRVDWTTGEEPLLAAVALTLATTGARPSPTGAWPAVAWRLPDDDTFVTLTPDPSGPQDGTLRYLPPDGSRLARVALPTLRIAWEGLPVATVQNGRAQVSVRRNEHLLPGVPTTDAFVMETPVVTATDVATPVVSWADELPLAGATLTAAVTAALTDLFGPLPDRAPAGAPPVTFQLAYGHQLIAPDPDSGSDGMRSWLPVALWPHQPLAAGLAAAVGAAADGWLRAVRPSPDGAAWGLSLTLSSNLPRRDSRPLLALERLVWVPPASGAGDGDGG